MPGGLTQIAAVGTADQYLVANPQITLFKQVWRRYTNFALESVQQAWTGDCDFGKKCTVVIARSGDLVADCWLQINLPDLSTLNHITGVQHVSTAPAIWFARSTSESSMVVKSYGSTGPAANAYVCSARSDNSPVAVGGITVVGSKGLQMVMNAPSISSVTLYPCDLDTIATPVVANVIGNVATVDDGVLVANVTYGVCVNNGQILNHVVQVQPGGQSVDPIFTLNNVDPVVPRYYATVLATVGGVATQSAEEIVMKAKWVNEVGHALISSVEWEMGGSRIDRHVPEHWSMWNELTESAEKQDGYSDMIGRYANYSIDWDARSFGGSKTLFVPLRFSFNTTPGSALPLVALQFHDVRLNFEFRNFMDLIRTNVTRVNLQSMPTLDCSVFATYVFLSQEERSRFAQMPHEYLIEQLQFQTESVYAYNSPNGAATRKFTLTLTHPVKEILWAFQAYTSYQSDTVVGNDWFNYDMPECPDQDIFQTARLLMNGNDRFSERPARYFRLVQPWSYHTRVPTKKIYVYSFSLHPEAANPSGAANYSRLDTSQLYLTLNPNIPSGRLRIHALSYNVLRIANGLSGVVFA